MCCGVVFLFRKLPRKRKRFQQEPIHREMQVNVKKNFKINFSTSFTTYRLLRKFHYVQQQADWISCLIQCAPTGLMSTIAF